METKKDFKHTLLMPTTDFPMRGNLGQNEPLIQARWEAIGLYELVMEKNAVRPTYLLHDGPPYANGSIHAGTAFNKSLKDFVIRYRNMAGFHAPYLPGWDTHGLPIETALTKDKHIDRKQVDIVRFRDMCADYALEQIDIQRSQFRRLGVLGLWEKPYITMDKAYEASQLRLFAEMVDKGLIYKGQKPVYWSPSSESALAEAEIEYHEVRSPSVYVAMPVADARGLLPQASELVVWTTTPWTIPANLAICLHPEIEYALVRIGGERLLVVARKLLESLVKLLGWTQVEILSTHLGSVLEGITYKHPFYDRISPVILGEHVTTEDGTGLVHTAPGHGEDDFIVGQKYGLEVLCPVDSHGKMTADAGPRLEGLFVEDCNHEVIKLLTEANALLKSETITHSYPHDWRTKKPVIFRATPQWFASIDLLKEDILRAIQTIKWYPSWGDVRLANMVRERRSWCISRQRAWGVPIPAFYTEKNTAILDKNVILHVADIVAKEGTNAWFTRSETELLPPGFTHPDSPNGVFRKETDIMDVWFDSGSSHHGAMMDLGYPYPADLYLEGSDQYRGWFNSSLTTGIATMGESPYRTLVSHGFILDGEGRKMSKSLGNVVDPNKIAGTLGADIFRLWVASVDYQADVRLSDELLKQVGEAYRKIRNTFKFLLGNLIDFYPDRNRVAFADLEEIDQYLAIKRNNYCRETLAAYADFRFDDVYRLTNNFVTFVSAFYLDFAKDVLYIERSNDPKRRRMQTVMFDILDSLLRVLTPLIPHTTAEAYQYLPSKTEADVYLLDMPAVEDYPLTLEKDYDLFMQMREIVLKALEIARNDKVIGKSLNARLILYPQGKYRQLLERINVDLKQVFIVSQLEISHEGEGAYREGDLSVDVAAAIGETCARCWAVVPALDEDGLCPRCAPIVADFHQPNE